METSQPSEEPQEKGFEVTEDPESFTLFVPEFKGPESQRRVARWIPKSFRGKRSEDHPNHVIYEEDQREGEPEEPGGFYKSIGSKLNPDKLIPDIVKGDPGRQVLKYIGAISAAVVLGETARRSIRAIRKRNS